MNILTKYQKKTDKEHVLDLPGTYIGGTDFIDNTIHILNETTNKFELTTIHFIPALLKLFDEVILNSRDHSIRSISEDNISQVTYIHTSIQDSTITIQNNGRGIDIIKHPEYNLWVPEMIFAHLRTSTNYSKDEDRNTAGMNGYGVKLVFIWSTYGEIETVDHTRKLKYTQKFRNNLDIVEDPIIETLTGKTIKPYTRVTFRPDYARLNIPEGLTQDMINLFKKRVYDISAITSKKVSLEFNHLPVPIKTFQDYACMYLPDGEKKIHESPNEHWEYIVALSPTHEFTQVSFVNGINTYKGGKHVDHIINQITTKISEKIEEKKKIKIQKSLIKNQLILFLNTTIINPTFDSQSKECLSSTYSKFGSTCQVSDKFIDNVIKLGVINMACRLNEIKETKEAKKKDGNKTKNIRGIPKLIDANYAGTMKSEQCVLILCEGDSAKAGVVSGLSSKDKDVTGVYPLKGKLINVRVQNTSRITDNDEIHDIKQILGLELGKEYKTLEDIKRYLRYSKVLILTDADVDGSHIKGLVINLFHSEWQSLINIEGFISFMNTPILKARKNNNELIFYNNGEYENWKNTENSKSWKIKYYKGLGTSTATEFKEYFKNKKIVDFKKSEECDDHIDMVFNKKKSDERKTWLKTYDRSRYLNTSTDVITYKEFIDNELIHFSQYDCERSIPNIMDGLKTSQRKILYSAFKRNLTTELKVAQFSGYVSEHSNYHHGEASLNQTIISMAQDFMGSNNINLFLPNGTFGSRLMGGSDHASERYIYTLLNPITYYIFNKDDNKILDYLNDDGIMVEPTWYCPIIPMILINGSKGIGTGYSTEILQYNPLDIIDYLIKKLNGVTEDDEKIFIPYYLGFNGEIKLIDAKDYLPEDDGSTGSLNSKYYRFICKGVYTVVDDDTIHVTELPVGLSITDFKILIEKLCDTVEIRGKKVAPIIKDYSDNSTDKIINFMIVFIKGELQKLLKEPGNYGCNMVEKKLKLYACCSTSNMHLIDANDKLKKYITVNNIIDEYYLIRYNLYEKRKELLINELEYDISVLSNKINFINENIKGTIELRLKKTDYINNLLMEKEYMQVDNTFNYLIKLPMDSVNEENVQKLENDYTAKYELLKEIKNTTIEEMWLSELNTLRIKYQEYHNNRLNNMYELEKPNKKKTTKKKIT